MQIVLITFLSFYVITVCLGFLNYCVYSCRHWSLQNWQCGMSKGHQGAAFTMIFFVLLNSSFQGLSASSTSCSQVTQEMSVDSQSEHYFVRNTYMNRTMYLIFFHFLVLYENSACGNVYIFLIRPFKIRFTWISLFHLLYVLVLW